MFSGYVINHCTRQKLCIDVSFSFFEYRNSSRPRKPFSWHLALIQLWSEDLLFPLATSMSIWALPLRSRSTLNSFRPLLKQINFPKRNWLFKWWFHIWRWMFSKMIYKIWMEEEHKILVHIPNYKTIINKLKLRWDANDLVLFLLNLVFIERCCNLNFWKSIMFF